MPASEITLPQLLQKHGYQTAHFGKWHLSHYSDKRGQAPYVFGGDKTQPTMKDYGYDYWFATGNVARPSHRNPQNFFRNGTPVGPLEGYSAQLVAGEVAQWLERTRTASQPFFMTVWFHEPHGPISSDPRFMDRYGDNADTKLKQYLGNITQIDEAVGAIVQSLAAAGLSDDTLVWFTSDNGPAGDAEHNLKSNFRGSTGGLRGRKSHTHEGGIRVPGIIKWPAGIQRAGTTSEVPIIGHDIFPTLLDIAGVALPRDRVIDGTSILPVLQGRPFQRSRPLYWRNRKETMRVAIRDGAWKMLCDSTRSTWELYNLAEDPGETMEQGQENPERFERMKATLIAYDNDVLDDGPAWWQQGSWKKSFPTEVVEKLQEDKPR